MQFRASNTQLAAATRATANSIHSRVTALRTNQQLQTNAYRPQPRHAAPCHLRREAVGCAPPEGLLRRVNFAPKTVSTVERTGYAAEPAVVGGWRIGQNVEHAKFGVGVIVATEGRGADARVQVNFGAAGMKWLALEYAKLTAL